MDRNTKLQEEKFKTEQQFCILKGQFEMEKNSKKTLYQENTNLIQTLAQERETSSIRNNMFHVQEKKMNRAYDELLFQFHQAENMIRELQKQKNEIVLSKDKAEKEALGSASIVDQLQSTIHTLQSEISRLNLELKDERLKITNYDKRLIESNREIQRLSENLTYEKKVTQEAKEEAVRITHRFHRIRKDHKLLMESIESPLALPMDLVWKNNITTNPKNGFFVKNYN